MKKSAQLIKERAALIEAQQRMHLLAEKETRDYTETETIEFRRLQGEIDAINEKVKDALAYEENLRSLAGAAPSASSEKDGEEKEKDAIQKRFSISRALRAMNPNNPEKLDGVEKDVHEIGQQESRNAGLTTKPEDGSFSLPISFLRASQQTVTQDGGTYGSALTTTQAPRLVGNFRPRLWLEELGAEFLTGLTGNVPLVVKTDFAMEWLAEGAAITPQKKEFAGPTLTPKRAGGAVDVSNQLIMQSSVDVEGLIMDGLTFGFQNLLHAAAINGPGGVAPTGILNYAGVLASAQVAAGAATWADIVELQGLIEANDSTEQSLGYLMHPKLKAALKQITKDAGSGQFLLNGKEVDGYKFIATTLMPILSSGTLFPLIYGDWSQMVIGQWGSINVKVNPYSADLSDSVRLVLNTHADMKIANPKAFAKNAYLTA